MRLLKCAIPILVGLGLAAIFLSASGNANAGSWLTPDAPPPTNLELKSLPLDSSLYYAAQDYQEQNLAQTMSPGELSAYFSLRGLQVDEKARLLVEIEGMQGGPPLDGKLIVQAGGQVTGGWRHLVEAFLPVEGLVEFARNLPPGYFIHAVGAGNTNDVDGEGPAATGSDTYRDNGANCSGMVIGVIDFGYERLSAAIANGDLPSGSRLITVTYSSNSFQANGEHGTAVAETVYDHCPAATYRLYKIDSDHSDFASAINNAVANNVDVIAHSASWYNTGWADNTGNICSAVSNLNNTLFFNSAGNRAQSHWQGNFSDPDSDQWHNWPNGSEWLTMTIRSSANEGFVNAYLSWNLAGGDADYDLYLYDSTKTQLQKADLGGNQYERLFRANPSANSTTWYLRIYRYSGVSAQLELFDHNGGAWAAGMATAANSTDSPSNCTNKSQVVAIGAVDWSVYGNANPAIQSYSSRGPTNSGADVIFLVAPTNTTTFAYSGSFGGTSASAPNAAGAGAAFWSDQDQLSWSSIRWLLQRVGFATKDWGLTNPNDGYDHIFGYGGIILHPWATGTVWLDRNMNNWNGDADKPYYYVSDAVAAAPIGGRLVFVGGFAYTEAVTINKNLLLEALNVDGWDAVLGSE